MSSPEEQNPERKGQKKPEQGSTDGGSLQTHVSAPPLAKNMAIAANRYAAAWLLDPTEISPPKHIASGLLWIAFGLADIRRFDKKLSDLIVEATEAGAPGREGECGAFWANERRIQIQEAGEVLHKSQAALGAYKNEETRRLADTNLFLRGRSAAAAFYARWMLARAEDRKLPVPVRVGAAVVAAGLTLVHPSVRFHVRDGLLRLKKKPDFSAVGSFLEDAADGVVEEPLSSLRAAVKHIRTQRDGSATVTAETVKPKLTPAPQAVLDYLQAVSKGASNLVEQFRTEKEIRSKTGREAVRYAVQKVKEAYKNRGLESPIQAAIDARRNGLAVPVSIHGFRFVNAEAGVDNS